MEIERLEPETGAVLAGFSDEEVISFSLSIPRLEDRQLPMFIAISSSSGQQRPPINEWTKLLELNITRPENN
jgi:hypothetical protein